MRVWRQGVELDQCLLPQASTTLRVGYMGQMKQHKGVDLLLKAWGQLKDTRPHFLQLYGSNIGEDAYGCQLQTEINRLNNVSWNGQFSGTQLWDILANLDILVVPSRWVENSPNSILEAQAVGVPIIGTNLGGIAELVQHERNGLLFEVDNADDLAKQLQRLLDEPNLLELLKKTQLPFLHVQDEINQLNNLYQEVVAKAIGTVAVEQKDEKEQYVL
jgi:glycosyltransferase involved in cell wall biosynthesis